MASSQKGLRALGALVAVTLAALAAFLFLDGGERGTQDGPPVLDPHAGDPVSPPVDAEPNVTDDPVLVGDGGSATPDASGSTDARTQVEAPEPQPFVAHVTDSRGGVVAGAWVRLAEHEVTATRESAQAVTDADGRFEVPVPAGVERDAEAVSLFLSIVHPGFVVEMRSVDRLDEQTFVLRDLPRIEGRVLDPDGLPVEGQGRVGVYVVPPGGGDAVERTAKLEPGGAFVIERVPIGQAETAWALVKGFPEREMELSLTLEPEALETIEIQLTAGARVVGIVVDRESREPVPGAQVWAGSRDFEPDSLRPTAVADAEGRFELTGVEPRRYVKDDGGILAVLFLLARAEGYTEAPLRAYASTWIDDGPYEFEIEVDPASCSLSGTVYYDDGKTPAQGAHVHAVDALGKWRFARTNRDGRFDYTDLPAGSIQLMARKGELEDEEGSRAAYADLELEASKPGTCEMILADSTRTGIEGTLMDGAGRPVAGVQVLARLRFDARNVSIGIDSAYGTSDEEGRYLILGIPAGVYRVRPETEDCVLPDGREVELAVDEARDDVDFTLQTCLNVAGRVLSGERAFTDLKVVMYNDRGEGVTDAVPGSDGTFELPPVPSGLYLLKLEWGDKVLETLHVGPTDARGLILSQ